MGEPRALKEAWVQGWFLSNLRGDELSGYVAGGRLPESDPAHSQWVDLGYSRQAWVWQDDQAHYHGECEEHYLVVEGRLELELAGQAVAVPAGHLLGVRAGTPHRVVGGQAPIESFLIRTPGGRQDKVLLRPGQAAPDDSWFLLDLRAPHEDYQAGACLPEGSPSYSPRWDFWSGWQVGLSTWRGQEHHYHNRAEEYYVVVRGRLDLELDGEVVSVLPGHLLGVGPGAVHGVVGGQEPLDTFFFRVPGGRGDKTVVGARRFLEG